MKKIFSLLANNTFFYLFFSITILAISFSPTFYRFLVTPADRTYTGATFYTDDYAVYTSVIQQGIDGRWTVIDKYTSEPHPAGLIHFHYLILGRLGRLFGLSSIITYHLARIFSSLTLILTIIYFIQKIVPKNIQKLSFLLILLSSGWPNLSSSAPTIWQKFYPQFINPDPAIRLVHQPHFLLGNIYIIIALLFFISLIKNITASFTPKAGGIRGDASRGAPTKGAGFFLRALVGAGERQDPDRTKDLPASANKSIIIFFLIFTAYVALADPAQTLLAIITIGIYGVFVFLITKNLKILKSFSIMFFLTALSAFIVYVYLRYVRSFDPWKTIALFDAKQEFPPDFTSFFLAFGPAALFAIIGIIILLIPILQNHSKLYIINCLPRAFIPSFVEGKSRGKFYILLFWLLSSLLLIFVFSIPFGINRLRFFNSPLYIPISIFAAYGVTKISSFVSNLLAPPKPRRWRGEGGSNLFAGLLLVISLPVFAAGLIYQFKEHPTSSALIYPPKAHIEAFKYLKENSKREETVLCLYEACNQIPYFSGNTAFIGNISETLNERYKSDLTVKIFSGQIQGEELKKELFENRISYLFIGYQEGFWQVDFNKYPFLVKFFENSNTKILKNTLL